MSAALKQTQVDHASNYRVGLHSHFLDGNVYRLAAAEFVGSFVLVLTIVATVLGASLNQPIAGSPFGSVAIAVAGGLGLSIGVAALGHISGAHFNPAVTIGLALNGRFPWRRVPHYVTGQLAGAVGGAAILWAAYGDRARSVAELGATSPSASVRAWQVLIMEAAATFILVLVVVAVATDDRASRAVAALSIGSALAAAILISGPISGAGVNPARAIGPMLLAGRFTDWWGYLIAPLVGGALAVTVYDRVLRPASSA